MSGTLATGGSAPPWVMNTPCVQSLSVGFIEIKGVGRKERIGERDRKRGGEREGER